MKINIDDYLADLRKSDAIYIPNPGNAGDSVIASASFQKLDSAGVRYKLTKPAAVDAKKRCLIYGGGGNLVNPHSFASTFISRHHLCAYRLVVLPHTIKDCDKLLASMRSNVDLICREPISYQYAKSTANGANVYLADDMAFGLDLNKLGTNGGKLSPPLIRSYFANRYFTTRNTQSFSNLLRALSVNDAVDQACDFIINGELNCFRSDGESLGAPPPQKNIDLSEEFKYGTESQDIAILATKAVINVLKQCKTINTDRLHIAISGALLGINVNFHPNNYYKCAAIYEYSIKNKFKNVVWHG